MFVIVLIVCFYFTFLFFCHRFNIRESFLLAAIVFGISLTTITEILSIFKLLTFSSILGTWLLLSFIWFLLIKKKSGLIVDFKIPKDFKLEILLVFFVITVTGLIALISPPNTWDSMTYHMSRVVHWIQNRSVAHYPTHILGQLFSTPWAEFAIMHFQILNGGDRFANFVQWFSMIGSILGVSLIAKQLGANKQGQILAAVVAVTIPMGILQASSTQNDYVVSFWLVCFVYNIILLKTQPRWIYSLTTGGSLGLAILTKATAYIFVFPFLVWFVFSSLKILKWNMLKSIFVVAIVTLFINLGFYVRNFDLFKFPLGIPYGNLSKYSVENQILTMPAFISNIIRNVALHIDTQSVQINAVIDRKIRQLHILLGQDINDPRTTFGDTKFCVRRLPIHEDETGNPIHLILIMVSLIFCLISRELRHFKKSISYVTCVIVAFLGFAFYLKWQPWHSRLHLPLFVLFSPFVAIVLSKVFNYKVISLISIFLVMLSFPWVFYHGPRPFIGHIKNPSIFSTTRIDLYFKNRQDLREPYIQAANFVKSWKCSNIGLFLADWEYPFWVLLKSAVVRIEHFGVKNISSAVKYNTPFNDFIPYVIISLNHRENKFFTGYKEAWMLGPVSIFIKE